MIIDILPHEREHVYHVARLKMAEVYELGQHRSSRQQIINPLHRWVIGCLGEYALAKSLHLEWGFMPYHPDTYDVAGIEVRTSRNANANLYTHDRDKTAIYVHANIFSAAQTVRFNGWARLQDCNIDAHRNNDLPVPCYETPRYKLWPMDMLPL